jgi:mono/diheme cytochrome c family protein
MTKAIAALLLLATPALADHCRVVHRQNVVVSSGAVITPFAIPVAVPTSVVQYGYTYSHADAARAYGVQSNDAALFEEFLAWKQQREAAAAQALPQTLLQKNCVGCHANNADAKEHFDLSGQLTSEQKLSAIAAVMKGKMPKNKPLDPQVRADLVAELSGVEPQGVSK